jgi:uncharacterized protein (TIGR03437 family)
MIHHDDPKVGEDSLMFTFKWQPLSTPSPMMLLFASAVLLSITLMALQFTSPFSPDVSRTVHQLPFSFVPNVGQSSRDVKFQINETSGSLYFTRSGISFALHQQSDQTQDEMHLQFVNANPDVQVNGVQQMPGVVNYLIGNDPSRWRTNVPTFAAVTYQQLYPGIDLRYDGTNRQLKGTYLLSADAPPSRIRWRYNNAAHLEVENASGQLLVNANGLTLREAAPVAWQEINGEKKSVSVHYQIHDDGTVGFTTGAYDHTRTLIIDPVIGFSTYLGGNRTDEAGGIAVDGEGNIVVTGSTESGNFPTVSALQPTRRGLDVFVSKFNPSGSALIFSTFLGGNGDDEGQGLAVDGAGNIYVAGTTEATNFPTANAWKATNSGIDDAFVAKLNASGSTLLYSTYLGGGSPEDGSGIAADDAGNAWVGGTTFSANFPTRNPVQASFRGPMDAFVAKINTSVAGADSLVFSTYLGGAGIDTGDAIAVDKNGAVYLTGQTLSADFPLTGALQTNNKGQGDLFITKLDGSGLVYSTLLGGSGKDYAYSIAVDGAGRACVTGNTESQDFVTQNAAQSSSGGGSDAFALKLSAEGNALAYSTYIGGSGADYGYSVDADASGNVFIAGSTASANSPVKNTAQNYGGSNDAFALKIAGDGTLEWNTFLGGSGADYGQAIAVDGSGNVFVEGETQSANFPTVSALQSSFGGGEGLDVFVLKLNAESGNGGGGGDGSNAAPLTCVSAASYLNGELASEAIASAFGTRLATATLSASSVDLPASLGGTVVKVRDAAGIERTAPLFFVSPTQVNYQLPQGTASGIARVSVISADGSISAGDIQVNTVAPGVFAADGTGRGLAAANVLRVMPDNSQHYESVAQYDSSQGKMVAVPIRFGAGDQVYLVLYGTGIRFRSALANVTVQVGGVPLSVNYASMQGYYAGLDQINVQLSRDLVGRGEVEIVITVDGRIANVVKVAVG